MKEESSLLEIFQDPLLTIIALVLLGTIWMIIPAKSDTSISVQEAQKEMSHLRNEISSLEKKIEELNQVIQNLETKLNELNAQKRERAEHAQEVQNIDELIQKIRQLQNSIEKKNSELTRLEKELEEARKKAKELTIIDNIMANIKELREEIETKEALLKQLQEKLKKIKAQQMQAEKGEEQAKQAISDIHREIQNKREEISALEVELQDVRKMAQSGGLGEYSHEKIKGKDPVWFEAIKNRVIPIDDKHHNMENYRAVKGGRNISVVKVFPKKSVKGESSQEIIVDSSEFQKELRKHNPQKEYIIFVLHNDSFEVFRRAREICFQNHFNVGWWPQEGPIYFSSGGEGVSVPGR